MINGECTFTVSIGRSRGIALGKEPVNFVQGICTREKSEEKVREESDNLDKVFLRSPDPRSEKNRRGKF